MQTLYYKADKPTSAKIAALLDDIQAVKARAKKLTKEVGADLKMMYVSTSWGRYMVTAFSFKETPDPKLWVRVKGTDGWRPRRLRNSDLSKRFDALRSDALGQIEDLVGQPFISKDGYHHGVGVCMKNGVAYLQLSEDATGKGCRRISDLTYEKATA